MFLRLCLANGSLKWPGQAQNMNCLGILIVNVFVAFPCFTGMWKGAQSVNMASSSVEEEIHYNVISLLPD